jgi:arylsulfatase A-like enzyme
VGEWDGREYGYLRMKSLSIPLLLAWAVAGWPAMQSTAADTKPIIEKYRGRNGIRNPAYAAMIEGMDRAIGRFLEALDDAGLRENTLVIFKSDNGGLATSEGLPTSNLPLRGGKGWVYEGGIREPWIVRWPGVVRPGTTCATPIISMDCYPTILQAAGIEDGPGTTLDGLSILPLLKQTGGLDREAIYFH